MTNSMAVPLVGSREMRLELDQDGCDVQFWRRHETGGAMMAGGGYLTAADIRLAIHGLRAALWALEREQGAQQFLRAKSAA